MAAVLELNMLEFLAELRIQMQPLRFLAQVDDQILASPVGMEDQNHDRTVPGDPLESEALQTVEERGGHQELREVHGTLLPTSAEEEIGRNHELADDGRRPPGRE